MSSKDKLILIMTILLVVSCGFTSILIIPSGEPECPKCEEKEYLTLIPECPECEVKTEYKDTPETIKTLEQVRSDLNLVRKQSDDYKRTACAYTGMYNSMFVVVKDYAAVNGLSYLVTQDMYDLDALASEFSTNCQ